MGSATIQFPIHRKEYNRVLEQGAAAAEGITSIHNFINLTFCYKQVSVVRDFRDLENIGRDHIITTQGRESSDEEWAAIDFHAVAMDLLQNGDGKITPYGVVFKNEMELTPLYTGGPFPGHSCDGLLMVTFQVSSEDTSEHILPLPMSESRLRRDLACHELADPTQLRLLCFGQAHIEEIISSLSLEKEDIFKLNRLAEELEELSPAEMEKLKAAVYLTEPDHAEKLLALKVSLSSG